MAPRRKRPPSDPALYRNPTGNRRPMVARYPGSCQMCGEDWVVGVTVVQRWKGREVHPHCIGKE